MPPPAVSVSAKDFLTAIWGDTKGVAELTIIGKEFTKALAFDAPEGISSLVDAAPRHNSTGNVYVGICLRRERWPKPTGRFLPDGKPEIAKRGTEDNVVASWCVWCEFDFPGPGHKGKVCPPELAKKMLQEFPLKPSIVVKSGGGIQPYWLFKEAVTGDDIWRVKTINKALVQHFTKEQHGADPQCVDLARIFRLPGTKNLKYNPVRLVEISWWDPDRRYTLDDFDMLPQEDPQSLFNAAAGQAGSVPPLQTPGMARPGMDGVPRQVPSIILNEETIREIGKLLGGIWFEGHRHQMALTVAGMLAWSGIKYESTAAIIQIASTIAGGDTQKRLKDVQDTYNNFAMGKEVSGKPKLLEMVKTEFPDAFRNKATQAINAIVKMLPKPPGDGDNGDDDDQGGAEPDFDIVKIMKFDSRPARFKVFIRKHGEDAQYEVECETQVLTDIRLFRKAFFEATENKFIAYIKQWRWEQLVAAAPLEIRKAPKVATVGGAILTVLEEFLEQKKENPELGILKTFPGYNDNEIFFQYRAFKGRLKDHGLKASDQTISDILEQDGWTNQRRWIGDKNPHLWVKPLKAQEEPKDEIKPPEPPPAQPELFLKEPEGTPPGAPPKADPVLTEPSPDIPQTDPVGSGTAGTESPAKEPETGGPAIPDRDSEEKIESWEDLPWDVGEGPEGDSPENRL